jgi:Zn-finger nucleic acid-binding protein
MIDREGVEIDYCPKHLGVRLDRGDLSKILEGSINFQQQDYEDSDEHHRYSGDRDHYPKKHRNLFSRELSIFKA